jgi:hypothetical protein
VTGWWLMGAGLEGNAVARQQIPQFVRTGRMLFAEDVLF